MGPSLNSHCHTEYYRLVRHFRLNFPDPLNQFSTRKNKDFIEAHQTSKEKNVSAAAIMSANMYKRKRRRSRTPTKAKTIRVGNDKLKIGSQITATMKDSTCLFEAGDFAGLLQNLREDGFIFVRGVIPKDR